MGYFLRIATCAAIFIAVLCAAAGWKKAGDAYEAKFQPAVPPDTKQVYYDDDPYCWVMNAEAMVRDGAWRIRVADFDNAPWGREMHYSQSVSWMIVLAGQMRALVTGEPLLTALPRAGIWVNPLLFAVFLSAFFLLVEGRLGFLPAGIGVVWLAAHGEIMWAFHPFRPDHQTFHLIFSLLSFVLLALGGLGWTARPGGQSAGFWIRPLAPPDERAARRYFLAAGILQALGLWTGAVVQSAFLTLTFLGVGSFVLLVVPKFASKDREFHPGLWRRWSIGGAATSVLMYLVEYFPNHLSLRLEVNHPLYALAWLGAGEALFVFLTARSQQRGLTGRERLRFALGVVSVAILPVILFLGGAAVYVLRDPETVRLLSLIDEFKTFRGLHGDGMVGAFLRQNMILPLFLLLGTGLLFLRRIASFEAMAVWLALVFAVATLAMGFYQQRWLCFQAAFSVWLMVLVFSLGSGVFEWRSWRIPALAAASLLLVASVVPLYAVQFQRLGQLAEGRQFVEQVGNRILVKRFALRLGEVFKGEDVRIMADIGLVPALAYFSGLRGVGSFYWENIDGVHDTDAFFDAMSDGEAEQIVRDRKITHVVMSASQSFPQRVHFVRTGELRLDPSRPNFAQRMAFDPYGLPRWLRKEPRLTSVEQEKTRFGPVLASGTFRIWRIEAETAK